MDFIKYHQRWQKGIVYFTSICPGANEKLCGLLLLRLERSFALICHLLCCSPFCGHDLGLRDVLILVGPLCNTRGGARHRKWLSGRMVSYSSLLLYSSLSSFTFMVIYSSTSSTSILGAAHNMKWLSGRMESYPPSCEKLYFQQKLCREGKTNAHRGTNPAVGWGKCESRELPWNPGFLWPPSTRPNNYILWNTKYQIPKAKYEIRNTKIFSWRKKTDVVVGRVPWWWWMYKKALLAFSSSQEFLLPSECLNIQHRVLCGNKTNILQTIWCTKNQKNIWSNPITHCISSYANL